METGVQPGARMAAAWQVLRKAAERVPPVLRLVLGFALMAVLLLSLHSTFAAKDSGLRIKVQHSFRGAQLSVWVDNDLAYSGRLSGSVRKRFGLIPDSIQGSMSQTFPISSGTHTVRVRCAADNGAVQEDSVVGSFSRNQQRTLAINARSETLNLSWMGDVAAPVPGDNNSEASLFARYAGTTILTIAGSIVSALTGFALRELPAYIRSRQSGDTSQPSAKA